MSTEFPPFAPLAIVGLGCLFPKADGPGAYWANVKHGIDGIGELPDTHWNASDYFDVDPKSPDRTYARRGGFLQPYDFNPLEFGIAPRDLEATDTSQLLGLVAAKQALLDARIVFADSGPGSGLPEQNSVFTHTPKPIPRDRVSVILGVTGTLELVIPLGARLGHPHWKKALKDSGVDDETAADVVERISDAYVPWQENSFPGLLGNVVAGRIANRLDLHGTNCVVDAACASSLSAVHLAAMELHTGKADAVVTGGVDTFNDIFMFMCFSKTPALSKSGDSKPFDASGDGTILGEGLGMIVLKRLADAERDGDRIYAVLKGLGTSSDGKGHAIYAPSAEGQKRCLRDAYARAGVSPGTIELVEAHGTGTKVGDAAEASALVEVYAKDGNCAPGTVAVGSVKSMIGHTKAAAGAASLIKATLSLYNKVLPPTLKVTDPVEPLKAADSPFTVNGTMRPWLPKAEHPRRAAVSAFGFGGSNFHAVLEEHGPYKGVPDWNGDVEILALSGADAAELGRQLDSIPTAWSDFARTAERARLSFSSEAPARLVLVAHRRTTDLQKLIAESKSKLAAANPTMALPDGAFFGSGPAPGKLAILFPGQGSQSVGMLRELSCTFPEMLEALSHADRTVVERIYPPTSYAKDGHSQQEAALRSTDVAQPAIGATSWGAFRLLVDRFGLEADAFAGHSFGELTALAAAGRIPERDFYELSALRGRLMNEQAGPDGGSMLAAIGSPFDIERILREANSKVVIANRNGPNQTVLSGSKPEIALLEPKLTAAKLRVIPLPVSAAFHSPAVAGAAGPFRAAMDRFAFQPSDRPVFSNSTAQAYPAGERDAKDLLAGQLARPVEFVDLVRNMLRLGVRTFVEVGPGKVLVKLVESILAETSSFGEASAFPLDAGSTSKSGTYDLALFLARLAALGYAVRLTAWEEGSRCRPAAVPDKPAMTIPISGANYTSPKPARPPRSKPVERRTTSVPTPTTTGGSRRMNEPTDFAKAIELSQQSLAALQAMQQQAAQLHQQFLAQQEMAQRSLYALIQQQQAMIGGLASVPQVVLPTVPVNPPQVEAASAPSRAEPIPAPKPVPPAPAAISPSNRIESTLLQVVSEKTGYPVSMLNLDMTLDSDLGVDSIKRVEILSALQDKLPEAPVVKPEHLGQLHSLRDVAGFLAGTSTETVFPQSDQSVPISELKSLGDLPITQQLPIAVENIDPASWLQSVFPEQPESSIGNPARVERILLDVVSEKTGYPASMLNLDMTLDSDLGVDSIKRVEILSTLQDRLPDSPVVKPEHLGQLHSLRDVAGFLSSTTSALAPKTEQYDAIEAGLPSHSAAATTPKLDRQAERDSSGIDGPFSTIHVDDVRSDAVRDSIDRSVPQVVDLDPNRPRSSIPFPDGCEFWIVADAADPILEPLVAELSRQRLLVRTWAWDEPAASGQPAGLVLIAPPVIGSRRIERLGLGWLQACSQAIRAAGKAGAALVATVSRLDGAFGLVELATTAEASSGGLAGLSKTVRHEWIDVAAKAIDLQPEYARSDPQGAAKSLAQELWMNGPLEVGLSELHRVAVEIARTTKRSGAGGISFQPRDAVVFTGGARGVTVEVAVAFAGQFRCSIALLGRTPLSAVPEPDWSAAITGEVELKAAIVEALGSRATPKIVEDQYRSTLAQREIRAAIARIERAGSKVAYFAADVTRPESVADALQRVQAKLGAVAGLVHGAGVLADKRIEDLTAEQFDRVYDTKVLGLRNLLDFLGAQSLKAIVLFSSTTARYGRAGQLAYAVANEVLNKTAQVEARRRPHTRVVAINWGPWDGGMVTPALKRVFEAEGVGLIPLAEGGSFAVHELAAAGQAVEVIALGKLRSGAKKDTESPPTTLPGRLTAVAVPAAPTTNPPAPELSAVFERSISLETHPVLRSHVIDGRAVVPMALHMEWLAHAALHGQPGLLFHGFNEIRVTNGIMIEDGATVSIRALAGQAMKKDGGQFHAPVELRGKRRDGREYVHSRGEVILAASLPKAPVVERWPDVQPYPHPLDEIYRYFLFHGPDLHGIERLEGISESAFLGTAYPAPSPREWLSEPLRAGWVADPLVLDTGFQMMILWSYAQHGAGSLPCFAGRYRQYRRTFPAGPCRIVIRITRDNGTFARADFEFLDAADNAVVATIQDYECVIDPQLNQAFRRNQLTPRVKA